MLLKLYSLSFIEMQNPPFNSLKFEDMFKIPIEEFRKISSYSCELNKLNISFLSLSDKCFGDLSAFPMKYFLYSP